MSSILLKNGTIVTVDKKRRIIKKGSILIEGNKIEKVTENEEVLSSKGAKEVDCSGKIIFPGLINTHTHLFQTLMKGLGDDRDLVDWWLETTAPMAKQLTREDSYRAAMLGCIDSIKSGTTTICDFMYAHPREKLSDPVIKAFENLGVRGIFGRGYVDLRSSEDIPEELIESPESFIGDFCRLYDTYHNPEGLISVGIAPNMIWVVSKEGLEQVREVLKDYDALLMMHISETPYEVEFSEREYGKKDIELLADLGLLENRFLGIHCVHLGKKEVRILKHYNCGVSHNPVSNMYLSSGVAPIPLMNMAGVPVGLAVDGAGSNNNQDMVETLKFASLLHKVDSLDPTVITAEKVLEMATIEGARALGIEDKVGSIEEGKRADLMIVNPDKPTAIPAHHPVSTLVYSASQDVVESVIVDGEIIMEERELKNVNEEEELRKASEAADSIVERAGLEKYRDRPWRSQAF